MRHVNPYLNALTRLPAYGKYDPSVLHHLAEVSLDPEEEPLASIKCNHGQGRVGHLTITNRRLRWFQRFPRRGHDYWDFDVTLSVRRSFPPVLELASGELFQARGLSPEPVRQFAALHQHVVEALRWEAEHPSNRAGQAEARWQ
jgi:hypothetical protein